MRQKKQLMRIVLSAFIFAIAILGSWQGWFRFAVFLLAYIIVGWDIVWRAVRNILRGQIFDENFLMTLATVGAFALGEYPEGVAVMLFYQIGELFQSYAVDKSRRSITGLMDIRPDYANVQKDGQLIKVDPEEVAVGDVIVIKPGERIPLDGFVINGSSSVDTSALTGESVPKQIREKDHVISGCINISGNLTVKVEKEFGESTVAKILDLVENSSSKKAKAENFITKFARYYTPVVVIAAVMLAFIPPLMIEGTTFSIWISRALTFLVISCPCALVISIPLSFFGGIGGASKCGVLVKGSNYLEALANTEIMVFDKTGTLTKGTFAVTQIQNSIGAPEELLEIAALAENYSNHPIALSIRQAYGKPIDHKRISEVEEIAGCGIKVKIDGKIVLVGNDKLMRKEQVLDQASYQKANKIGTIVHIAIDQVYAGYLVIADEVKEDVKETIGQLRSLGLKQLVMLTGDNQEVGQKVAQEIGLDQAYTELLPADKVEKMEDLLQQKSSRGKLAFVGDGINDAPVLARADIGIAMGGLGSDAAIEAADVVIMTDEPSKIPVVMRISKKTLCIVKQNIVFALGVKFIVLILGALGIATMWAAVFADVGVSVIAILNAIRALKVEEMDK